MSVSRSPTVSVVMPVYNVARFVERAMASVLGQTLHDLELIIVDDGSQDGSIALCEAMADHRVRIVRQANRGLAGARNSGIALARGRYVALIDSDDAWVPEKLERHVVLMDARPEVGITYSDSALVDEHDRPLGIRQKAWRGAVQPEHVFCGRVICNGSVPVFRWEVFADIARVPAGADRVWYFDETLRRSEDVECWTRIALTTQWEFASVEGDLTCYRINAGGLSADVMRQLESWDIVACSITEYAPDFMHAHGPEARSRELRYLARRALHTRDGKLAWSLMRAALRAWPRLLLTDPAKTMTTLLSCAALLLMPAPLLTLLLKWVKPGLARAPGT